MSDLEFNLVECRDEKMGMKQTILNLFSTIGRKNGRSIANSFSLYNMKEPLGNLERKGSITSLNSITQTYHIIGSGKLQNDIASSSPGRVKEEQINLKQDKKSIGKISIRYVYIPYYSKPNKRVNLKF